MICIPIIEATVGGMVSKANSTEADLVELRLDHLTDFSDITKLKKIKRKKIATCMPSWEGGRFRGSENERIGILMKTLEFVDYVTVELKTKKTLRERLIKKAKEKKVKVIVAFHDFKSTPSYEKIKKILNTEKSAGADIAKIVFTPKNDMDVLTVIKVMIKKPIDLPLIALSMGELGMVTRILALPLGAYLTFASLGEGEESAPGQLTVKNLKKILSAIK